MDERRAVVGVATVRVVREEGRSLIRVTLTADINSPGSAVTVQFGDAAEACSTVCDFIRTVGEDVAW